MTCQRRTAHETEKVMKIVKSELANDTLANDILSKTSETWERFDLGRPTIC